MALGRRRDERTKNIQYLIRTNDVESLSDLLLNPDTKGAHRNLVIDGLFRLDSQEAWEAIGHALTGNDQAVVEMLITQLDEIATPQAMKAAAEALSNRNVFIRSSAVRVLSKRQSGQTLTALLRASRDPDKSIARMAARTILRRVETRPRLMAEVHDATAEGILGLMDDRWSMELLSPSYPENIRILAAQRLGTIGGDEASHTLASIAQATRGAVSNACWEALERCPSVSEFVMLPLLVDPNPETKAKAISIYAKFSDETAIDLITGLTRDAAPVVRKASLKCLATLAPVPAIPVLEAALDDADVEVKSLSMDLLCNIEDSSPELVRAVFKRSGENRRKALVCLANRGIITSDLVPAYIEFLYKGSSCTDLSQRDYLDSLATTAKTLGQSMNFEAMLALTSLAHSVIRRLRRAAIEGLMEFPPEDRVDALYSLAGSHDADIVKNVAFGLHEVGDKRAVVPLIRCAMECRGKPMVKAKDLLTSYDEINEVQFLIKGLSERWASVRKFSAERLRIVKDASSIPALLIASRDEDVEVQLAVFEAMGPFAAEHEDVTERMLEAISYGDISVRQAVCEALGEARCKAAVPELVRALSNCFLRPRASDAIRRIGDRKGFLALKRLEIREKLFKRKPEELPH
ncbi:MAG: HEAT repeat domain-containing protein [Planctomycetes bacterium]|nr:HEAT repeat domain-containing protein [Planctomycetota bacterium]